MELTQIRLLVSDFPAVYRFYRDVLGLKPQFEAENGPYAKLSPDTGHAAIALQDRAQMAGVLGRLGAGPEGYRALVVLRVDDLDAAFAGLTAQGAEFVREPGPMGDRMRVAYLSDPEGNLIELQQWLALREQAGGAAAQEA
ncbi:VOC family protein [Streptomyces cocklensis]|jgi:predicted enzyme related to lactoylglutathione lyase|uniref:Extradiol dioxygenase n=1 Tax=Actinacidiphila cocklensis TaxID=887465 RepID=A0A9W4E0H7_9ACTN|nr:VOC family protein [Actinacidiphila cocklensis]MDD1063563.1 VOC family protein [Actinacidiphila cocklensis]WSX72951.1 VOC family protein [Streptomyces sp. NBC_00899]WSX80982.1 VOC family protein [Streptomyces sp. NBC_00899]CAG6391023.1 Extradiol dioxygenase [Actinacidiphila cocklensis]